jgi:hypothetical protein
MSGFFTNINLRSEVLKRVDLEENYIHFPYTFVEVNILL